MLGGDEDYTVGRASSIDCRCGRALQNLDVLDVLRVDVDHSVRGRCALELTAVVLTAYSAAAGIDRVEVGRRERVVRNGDAVDDEKRLYAATESTEPTNLDA